MKIAVILILWTALATAQNSETEQLIKVQGVLLDAQRTLIKHYQWVLEIAAKPGVEFGVVPKDSGPCVVGRLFISTVEVGSDDIPSVWYCTENHKWGPLRMPLKEKL